MKGVSAIIAIILILMIVVALAALAYTWFTGIFASLTGTTETAVTATTTQLAYSFVIESAKCIDTCGGLAYDCISAVIRNTGQEDIDCSMLSTYVAGKSIGNDGSATISTGEVEPFVVGIAAGDEPACPGDVGKALTVTIVSGLEQSKTIE
jgi:flagellin-like protein